MNNFEDDYRKVIKDTYGDPRTRKEMRLAQVIAVSIKLFSKYGYDETSLKEIAKKCRISQSLLNHYFEDKSALFLLVIRAIRRQYQVYVVNEMQAQKRPKDLLAAYVRSALEWEIKMPEFMSLSFIFFHKCAVSEDYKKMNIELVKAGHERIRAILERGVELGEFRVENAIRKAKDIQNLIMSTLIVMATECETQQEKRLRVEGCQKAILDEVLA